MKQSRKLISNLMEQYLDDLYNFGEDTDIVLCENFFKRSKTLLNESKNSNGFKLLAESVTNKEEEQILKDFRLYAKSSLENETN